MEIPENIDYLVYLYLSLSVPMGDCFENNIEDEETFYGMLGKENLRDDGK